MEEWFKSSQYFHYYPNPISWRWTSIKIHKKPNFLRYFPFLLLSRILYKLIWDITTYFMNQRSFKGDLDCRYNEFIQNGEKAFVPQGFESLPRRHLLNPRGKKVYPYRLPYKSLARPAIIYKGFTRWALMQKIRSCIPNSYPQNRLDIYGV